MITGGEIFHDGIGLTEVLDRFRYYPDVWYYLMIAGWWRVHPEMNLVGRTGFLGDEVGSAIIGAGLVSDLMSLCFLLERRYAPYAKWFADAIRPARRGTAPGGAGHLPGPSVADAGVGLSRTEAAWTG